MRNRNQSTDRKKESKGENSMERARRESGDRMLTQMTVVREDAGGSEQRMSMCVMVYVCVGRCEVHHERDVRGYGAKS